MRGNGAVPDEMSLNVCTKRGRTFQRQSPPQIQYLAFMGRHPGGTRYLLCRTVISYPEWPFNSTVKFSGMSNLC